MKRGLQLFGLLVILLIGAWAISLVRAEAATVTPGTDITTDNYGSAKLDSNYRLKCSAASPGAVLHLPGNPDAGIPLDNCSTVTISSADIGTLSPIPGSIPLRCGDGKLCPVDMPATMSVSPNVVAKGNPDGGLMNSLLTDNGTSVRIYATDTNASVAIAAPASSFTYGLKVVADQNAIGPEGVDVISNASGSWACGKAHDDLSSPFMCMLVAKGDTTTNRIVSYSAGVPLTKSQLDLIGDPINIPGNFQVQGNMILTGQALVATPAVSPTTSGSIAAGTNNRSVVVGDHYAFVANWAVGGYVEIFDITNPKDLQLANHIQIDYVYSIAIAGSIFFATTSANQLLVYDVSNVKAPVLLKTVTGWYSNADIKVYGNHVIGAGSTGIKIADWSNPATTAIVGSVTISGAADCQTVSVEYPYAWIGCSNDASHSYVNPVDITNPAAPATTGTPVLVADYPKRSMRGGRYLYVISQVGHALTVLDLLDPASPVSAGTPLSIGSTTLDIALMGKYAWVSSYGDNKLYLIDISAPALPVSVMAFTISNPFAVMPYGRYLLVAGYATSGVFTALEVPGEIVFPSAEIGSFLCGRATVRESLTVGTENIIKGVTIGPDGATSSGPVVAPDMRSQSVSMLGSTSGLLMRQPSATGGKTLLIEPSAAPSAGQALVVSAITTSTATSTATLAWASVQSPPYVLPIAGTKSTTATDTSTTLGGVKIGPGISESGDGTISVIPVCHGTCTTNHFQIWDGTSLTNSVATESGSVMTVPEKLSVTGARSLLNSQANSTGARNYGVSLWSDDLFGLELGYASSKWTARLFTRDAGAVEIGKYPTGSTTNVEQFLPFATLDDSMATFAHQVRAPNFRTPTGSSSANQVMRATDANGTGEWHTLTAEDVGGVGCHGTCSTNYLQKWDGTGLTNASFSDNGSGITIGSNITYPGTGVKGIWSQSTTGTTVQGSGTEADSSMLDRNGAYGVQVTTTATTIAKQPVLSGVSSKATGKVFYDTDGAGTVGEKTLGASDVGALPSSSALNHSYDTGPGSLQTLRGGTWTTLISRYVNASNVTAHWNVTFMTDPAYAYGDFPSCSTRITIGGSQAGIAVSASPQGIAGSYQYVSTSGSVYGSASGGQTVTLDALGSAGDSGSPCLVNTNNAALTLEYHN